jgi:hypothetical protein
LIGMGTCGPPEELDPCDPTVGCATSDLNCFSLTSTISFCLRSCSVLGDCPMLNTSCQNLEGLSICFYNACGPGWPMVLPVSGASYYAPCNVVGTGDGYCIPAESPLGTVGVCLQGGSLDGGPCNATRIDGGAYCGVGAICAAIPDGGPSGCNPICMATQNGAVDGGPTCDAGGSVCANVYNAAFDFGQCLYTCNGPGTCLGDAVCARLSSSESVCFP